MLAQESQRRERLNEVLAAWEAEAGPLDEMKSSRCGGAISTSDR